MNDSPPLNEKFYDSKIWKKDSQDEKEEFSILTEKNDFSKNKSHNSQTIKTKKSKNSSLNSNSNSNSNNSNSINNNSDNNNNHHSSNQNNNISNKKVNNNSNGNNTVQKKFSLPLTSLPYSLKKKKEINNTNNTNKSKNIIKPIGTKGILQSLPSYCLKSKDQKVNMLERIKDKVNKEIKENNNKIIPKLDLKNNKNKSKANEKRNDKDNKNESINKINKNQTNNSEDKKDNHDFEEEELMDDQDDEVLQINKVASIDVKSNIMNNNFSQSNNQYYSNNSNNNINKSLTKEKCFTESDDSFHISNLFDPPSGRSNNSNNTFLTANSYQGNKTEGNYPYSSRFQFANALNNQNNINNTNTFFLPRKNIALMGSFLSTGTNSYSHSGKRFDTSNSNESGQSPHNFNVMQRQLSNNNLNNNCMMQFNPLETYSNNFNSKEFVFKQPFSLNTSFYYKKNKNNLFSKNNETKEKQIINLEDIARGIEKRTTVMIRNVPIKYNTKVLEKELEYFNGKFDCLYIPFDYENGGNKGYAFLNLVNPYHVLLFYEVFQGKCWSFFESKKICELNFANFQGINEIKKHAKHYKGTKRPTFYINTNNNTSIEVPKKYLHLILEKNPNLKYHENKMLNTIIINSFK